MQRPYSAIVLSCDQYHPLADHMIESYQRIWPNNPFEFRVPYQKYPKFLKVKYGDKIELIKTKKSIKATVDALLKDIEDEAFVYWCIDDKYLIKANQNKLNEIVHFVNRIKDPKISGILFCRCRGLISPRYLDYKSKIGKPERLIFIQRKDYSQIWIHQFLRAKVLKQLFESFPDEPFMAKQMDHFISRKKLSPDSQLYVSGKNFAIFGESTSRGRLTLNCVQSMKAYGLEIPKGFETCNNKLTMGRLPWQFLGISIPNVIGILSRIKNELTRIF